MKTQVSKGGAPMKLVRRPSVWIFVASLAMAILPSCKTLSDIGKTIGQIFDCECRCSCVEMYPEGGGGGKFICINKGNFSTCADACHFGTLGGGMVCF